MSILVLYEPNRPNRGLKFGSFSMQKQTKECTMGDLELVDVHHWGRAIQEACGELQGHVGPAVLGLPLLDRCPQLLPCP